MRKFIIGLTFLLFGSLAQAQYYHRHHHHGSKWIAPVIIGGVVGYAIANSARAEPPPPVIYVEQLPLNNFCPLGYRPVYGTAYVYDRWGRMIPQQQFLGCQ